MYLSPPSTVKEIIGREPVYANIEYLYELWSKGKMRDEESVKKLNRRYLGIDISDKYCEVAEKRLKNVLPDNKLIIERLKE